MSSQSTKERKAKLRAAVKLKHKTHKENLLVIHNGSKYDIDFDGYCHVENKILKYSHGEKSFIIYADLECWLGKMLSCQNNLENTEKLAFRTF